MELMAGQCLALTHQQAVMADLQAPVAHLQPPFAGLKRKHSGHGMDCSVLIANAFAEEEHAAAFGIDGPLTKPLPQAREALFALAEGGGMELRESARQDQAAGLFR